MFLNDYDKLALSPAHDDTARAVDDQHSVARQLAHRARVEVPVGLPIFKLNLAELINVNSYEVH